MPRPILTAAACFIILFTTCAASQPSVPLPSIAPATPARLPTESLPAPWLLTTPDFMARLVEGPKPGTIAIELAKPTLKNNLIQAQSTQKADAAPRANPPEESPFGNVVISLPAANLAGRTIRFTADVRTNESAQNARLWLRVDRKSGEKGFSDNMSDRPIKPGNFKPYAITALIDDDAEFITLGCMLFGPPGSTVIMASPRLRAVVEGEPGNKPAAALSAAGRQNLIAAGKLAALLRHFHPDSRCEQTNPFDPCDFDLALIRLLDDAEPAADPAALLTVLNAFVSQFSGTAVLSIIKPGQAKSQVTPPAPPAARPSWATHNVALQHFGVGLEMQHNIYWSRRIVEHQSTPAERSKIAAAATPFIQDLARGITITIPLTLPCDSSGSTFGPLDNAAQAHQPALPRAATPAPNRPDYWSATADDRTVRLAGVLKAWTTLNFFYPYFQDRPVDWPEALDAALDDAAIARDSLEYLAVLRRMIARLEDGHGNVLAPGLPETTVLPLPLRWADGKVVISRQVTLRPESLRKGDILLSINDEPIDKLIARYRAESSGATPGWINSVVLRRIAATPTAKRAEILVHRDGKDVLVRTNRVSPDAALPAIDKPTNGAELAPGIVYYNLGGLKTKDLTPSLVDIANAKGVVFDLRGYPDSAGRDLLGHLLKRSSRSLQMLVPLRVRPDDAGLTWQNVGPWELRPKTPRIRGHIVFVTDSSAISYAESCLSIIESLKLGTIVGEQTAGTNGNINTISLPGGFNISFTGTRVIKDDGSPFHGVGVVPQHIVHPTIAGIKAGRDEQLEMAVRVIQAAEGK